jgi:hypothetical protein
MDQSVGLGSFASRCCRAELQTFKAGEASTSVTVARSLQNGSSRPSFVPRKQQQQQPPPALLLQQRLTVFAEQKEALSGVEERTGSRLGFEDRENSDRHSMNFAAVSVDDPTPAAATASSNATVAVTNLGNNMRKMEATIAIQAPLEAVWGVLTDYEHLADHIPGLAVSQILERRPSGARLLQVGCLNSNTHPLVYAKFFMRYMQEFFLRKNRPQTLTLVCSLLRCFIFDGVKEKFYFFKFSLKFCN